MKSNHLTAIVLAAGEGKRMKTLGAKVSKVMLPVLGKPVLDYVVTNIIEAGVKNIILVVSPSSYRPVQKYFDINFKGVDINYVVQKEQFGPSHALSLAISKIKSDYFLVQYGDSLADQNIAKNLTFKLSRDPRIDGVLAVRIVDDPTRYGIIRYRNNRVVEIVEKPKNEAPSNHAVIGTFILKTKLFRQAIGKIKFRYGKEKFPAEYVLKKGGMLATWIFGGKRVDIAKPQDLFAAGQLLAKSSIKCIAFDADNTLYNTHQVARLADLAAFKILADKVGIGVTEIYRRWQKIVDRVKYSKDPQKRTRLYSYELLISGLNLDKNMGNIVYNEFTRSLTKTLAPAKNIKKILTNLNQTKIVITDDIKSLATKKLKSVSLYKFFSEIITSDNTKIMKPSKKFYKKLLAKYLPGEILVVGDDWEKDLAVPASLGVQVLFIEKEDDFEKLEQLTTERIHIMGIAGAGASAIAGIAQGSGYQVSGCDLAPNSNYIKNLKVDITAGHNPKHLDDIDILIISPAVEKLDFQNRELQRARRLKIPILTWQEFQGRYLQKDKFVICVAGAYGKSTTTAMTSQILIDAGFDPTCEIGAVVLAWQSNFRVGGSKYFVCEGDEYNNNFLNYKPDIAVVLNVAWDHPDFFKSEKEVFNAYQKFISNIKPGGTLIVSNDVRTAQLAKSARPDIKIIKVRDFGKLKLAIIGNFRRQNADAALTVAKILSVDSKLAKKSLENFGGVSRRLEYKGKISGIKFYDDYAVQPYTILKTASALRERLKDKKLALILEPHTFSRIGTFFDDFVKSLKDAKVNQIFITDVYAAREKGNREALSQKLASAVGGGAKYTGSLKQTAAHVRKHLNDFDVICSIGAGDVYQMYDLIKKEYARSTDYRTT